MSSGIDLGPTCTICWEVSGKENLQPVDGEPGKVWDVCKDCWHWEEWVKQQLDAGVLREHVIAGIGYEPRRNDA